MSSLAFFPWLRLATSVTVDKVTFLPYQRGKLPFASTPQQDVLDTLIGRYRISPDGPVVHAVIAAYEIGDPTRQVSESEIDNLFELRELIAVSALSCRPYFENGGFRYCNSHNFSLVVQRFENPASGVNVTSRRRDGQAQVYWSADTYRVQRPDHVPSPFVGLDLDIDLLEALTKARENPQFERIAESLAGFNLANTDSSEVFQRVELMLINGAFERLLDCRSGKEEDLAREFVSVIRPTSELLAGSWSRTAAAGSRGGRSVTVREVWIRDFFRSRGDLAHGRIKPGRPLMWSLDEHLLLGSFIFPLALKVLLWQKSFYNLTADDRDLVDIFEKLLVTELFKSDGHEALADSWPWNQVMEDMQTRRLARALTVTWNELGGEKA